MVQVLNRPLLQQIYSVFKMGKTKNSSNILTLNVITHKYHMKDKCYTLLLLIGALRMLQPEEPPNKP